MMLQSNEHNNAQLQRALLVGFQFENLIVNNSNFIDTNWAYAIQKRGEFNYFNFSNAQFNYTIIAQSNITPEQLNKAKSMWCAVMPDGTK